MKRKGAILAGVAGLAAVGGALWTLLKKKNDEVDADTEGCCDGEEDLDEDVE